MGVFVTKTTGVAMADAKTEVFQHTQAYIEGQNKTARKMYMEWVSAEKEDKETLCKLAGNSFSATDLTIIKDKDIRAWLEDCR